MTSALNSDRLKKRAAGRAAARDCFSLVFDGCVDCEFAAAFLDEMRALALPEQASVERSARKRELALLAASSVPFGRYANVPLSDIPRDYLHWLVEATEDTKNLLVSYLELTKLEDEWGVE